MRSFIISVAILIITVSFVAVNAAVFACKTDEIGAVLYSLPSSADTHNESEDALVNLIALESFIERNENYFQIFIPGDELRIFCAAALDCTEYYRSGDYPSYLAALKSAKQCLILLKLNESFTLGNII